MALHHILESFEHVLSPWIADIFSVGHEIIETFISCLNVISGGSFNKNDELEGNFEKKQIGFNPFGSMDVDRFLQTAFRPAVDVL